MFEQYRERGSVTVVHAESSQTIHIGPEARRLDATDEMDLSCAVPNRVLVKRCLQGDTPMTLTYSHTIRNIALRLNQALSWILLPLLLALLGAVIILYSTEWNRTYPAFSEWHKFIPQSLETKGMVALTALCGLYLGTWISIKTTAGLQLGRNRRTNRNGPVFWRREHVPMVPAYWLAQL